MSFITSKPPLLSAAATAITAIVVIILISTTTIAGRSHLISFRSTNLYPEGLVWDPSAQHFLAGSLHHRNVVSVSDAGIVETLIFDPSLPPNATILGLSVDSINHRLLAVVHSAEPLPPFNALAAYDLQSHRRIFLSDLSSDEFDNTDSPRSTANDVAVDFKGNAYVTNSARNYVWKVNSAGESSIFSSSPIYSAYPVDRSSPYSYCGLNGIVYSSKGYLLVVQSNTGKVFKVNAVDGTARLVLLSEDLTLADGIAMREDGVVLVVSHYILWFLKSQDNWGEGVVFDKTALDVGGFPTSVAVGGEDRAYVLYGHVEEGILGKMERDVFRIEEVRSEKESSEDKVWIYVLLGLGLAYFMFWRFQMGQLVKNMDKKIN